MSAQSESTLWLLPPAYEFAVADTGRLSLEIGLTPALLEIGSDSEQAVDPRAGVLMYPRGEMRGFALYAGVGRRGAEGGVWYVWRRDRGTLGTLDSFRVGIGFVTSADPDSVFPGQLGIGAAVGFSL